MKALIETTIQDVVAGRKTVSEATELLLEYMGRGGRVLVIDENLFGVEPHLARMGYSTRLVTVHAPDAQIIPRLKAKVLITRNGRDFADFVKSGYFGLVLVTSGLPDPELAEKIKDELTKAEFGANLPQMIKV